LRRASKERVAHAIQEATDLRLLFAAEFADASIRTPESFILHQHSLHQSINGVWSALETTGDRFFRFPFARRRLQLRESIEQIFNQLTFIRCHEDLPARTLRAYTHLI
jgi:hypothetical protein